MENKLKELQDKYKIISLRTDLYFNEKFLLSQIQELEEEILILMNELQTKKVILQTDKYKKQILIYNHQLLETKKQIKENNGKFN